MEMLIRIWIGGLELGKVETSGVDRDHQGSLDGFDLECNLAVLDMILYSNGSSVCFNLNKRKMSTIVKVRIPSIQFCGSHPHSVTSFFAVRVPVMCPF